MIVHIFLQTLTQLMDFTHASELLAEDVEFILCAATDNSVIQPTLS